MSIDKGLHLMHPAAITWHFDLGKTCRRQCPGTFTLRQFIEYGKKLSAGIESVLDATERIKFTLDFPDGIEGETEPFLSLHHHLLH